MRFTAMFRYSLRALSILADNYDSRPVSAREISKGEDISAAFLEQLLATLRQHGIINGVRGPGGGFRLSKPPGEILISQIVEAIEGPFMASSCLDGNCGRESGAACAKFGKCPVVPLLDHLQHDINGVLSSYRLSDVKRLLGG